MAFHFRLVQEDGTDLGAFSTSEPNWQTGHLIQRATGDALEVIRLVDAADGDNALGYLIIKAASEQGVETNGVDADKGFQTLGVPLHRCPPRANGSINAPARSQRTRNRALPAAAELLAP